MKKSDLVLAQKSLAARQVKNESQWIKEELQLRASMSPSRMGLMSSQSRHRLGTASSSPHLKSMSSLDSTESYFSFADVPRKNSQSNFHQAHEQPALSTESNSLVHTLSQRSLTDATQMRKKQIEVVREVQSKVKHEDKSHHVTRQEMGSRMSSHGRNIFANDRRPYTSSAMTAQQTQPSGTQVDDQIDLSDNFFMPKKKIVRPDGASLLDVYESKRSDTWGHIIKAQYREELEQNEIKRQERERANKEYGIKLRQQLDEKERAKQLDQQENSDFAALEDATAKRTEDLQKRREQEAVERHKQFINNALEDIALKRHNHEIALRQELTASTIMVNNAKKMIALDEEKKNKTKDAARLYQEQMYQENLENVARKEKQKNDSFAEDRRINREREMQHQRDEKRKKDELEERMKRTTEGPAHHIVQKISEAKRLTDEDLQSSIMRADNMLNTQLKASEDAAKRRAQANGESLEIEWQKNTEYKKKKKQEDEERNAKIIATMHKMLHDQEAEDREKREKRHQDAMKYQHDLDNQLHNLRQRSIDSLKKTMSVEEMKYNKQLMQTTAKYLPDLKH